MMSAANLSSLNVRHPRLFLNAERLSRLQDEIADDPVLVKLKTASLKQADAILKQSPTEFRISGPRMLERCQQILLRVSTLALAFRISGHHVYLVRAKEELYAAGAFPHWNPSHFLDTAELCTAFAIGYDWLHDHCSEAERQYISSTLVNKGLLPGLELQSKPEWWVKDRHNWNIVCNGGLAIGALAIADEQPELASSILDAALANIPLALDSFAPDGAWDAGPHYWEYSAWYSALTVDALMTALGTDFGISSQPGLDRAGLFPLYCAGSSGQYFNFADAETSCQAKPTLFWLGQRYLLPNCIAENHRLLRLQPEGPHPFDLVWYQSPPADVPEIATGAKFANTEVIFMRGSWDNPQTVFVGVKAGSGQADHGHLDLGSFVIDALGVRWACDLGPDDYDLDNYWDSGAGGGRWDYYRLNNMSHNTLVLNDHLQDPMAKATASRTKLLGPSQFSIMDLGAAYRCDVESLQRGVALIGDCSVLVQDEIVWSATSERHDLRWQLMTDADISLDGRDAALTKAGQFFYARILSPCDACFEVNTACRNAPENPNRGFRQLIIKHSERSIETRIAVLLSTKPALVEIVPLRSW